MAARAILALWGTYDRDEDGEPTDDALLGAVLESQTQVATLSLERLMRKAWFK